MSLNRSLSRNASFHDTSKPDKALGELRQNWSITEAHFVDILGILVVIEEGPIHVQERLRSFIASRTDMHLQTGVYDIYYNSMCHILHHLVNCPIANFARLYQCQE